MQCEELEDRLNAVLDERRRPEWDAELRLHCESCPECREIAATYDIAMDGFYALAVPEAPADMALRVMADVEGQPTLGRRSMFAAVAALAMAATVLIAVGPLLWAPSHQPSTQVVSKAEHAVATAALLKSFPLEQLPMVPELLSIATSPDGDPYAGLAKETGQGLAVMMLQVPGIGGTKGIIDAESDDNEEPAWAVQLSEGLKPVTDSVTETVNLLMRSLPVSQLAGRL